MRSVSGASKLILLLIVVAIFFVYFPHLSSYPLGRHIWAKSDFLALAEGFIVNRLDFFHPQSYQLNLQFPSAVPLESFKGITPVDFPIHPYLVACISTIFKTVPIQVIFRLYTFAWSVFAAFMILHLSFRLKFDYKKALFLSLLFLLNPGVFLYQFGFQPTSIALDCTIIGSMFTLIYFRYNLRRDLLYALFFFTIATLVRTTHILFFAALGITLLWRFFIKKERLYSELIATCLSGLFIIGYYIYNSVLAAKYGSIFLGSLMLPESWHDLIYAAGVGLGMRFMYYLPFPLLILIVWIYVANRREFRGRLSFLEIDRSYGLYIGISAVLVLTFFVVMMRQFIHHDYYLLDTFTPLFFGLILFLFLFDKITISINQLVIFVVLMFSISAFQYRRVAEISKQDRGYQTQVHFENSEQLLTDLGIGYNAKILVLDAYAPNVPFLQMKRSGFIVLTTSKENIERAFTWPFDYCITQNAFFDSDIIINFPDITESLKQVAKNENITVWQLTNDAKQKYQSMYDASSVHW